jgi:hypothetical protein
MTDYYPLIARAVEELGKSTEEARQALYERARNAVAQLRSNSALLESDIAKECFALEEAIRTVEAETAGKSRTEKRTKPQSAAPTEGTPDDCAQVASKSPRRDRADPPPAGLQAAGASPVLPTAREQLLSERSSRKRQATKGSRDVVRDVPNVGATTAKATQPARQARQPYEPDAPQYPPAKAYRDTHELKRKAAKGSRDVVRDGPDLGATTAKATQTARRSRQPYERDALQYPPAKEYLDTPEIAPEVAVRADAEIPERGMTVTWSLRRNTDKALPASYTIETIFKLSADFHGGGIADVPGILTKQAEQARGTELAGQAIKVTEGFFLIGLSAGDTDVQRNEQLLKDRPWFDIPIVYTNGGRALLAMEKGPPGARAFAEAFAVWKKEITPGTE